MRERERERERERCVGRDGVVGEDLDGGSHAPRRAGRARAAGREDPLPGAGERGGVAVVGEGRRAAGEALEHGGEAEVGARGVAAGNASRRGSAGAGNPL